MALTNKIDLKRMEKLLNTFKTDIPNSDECSKTNNINIDMQDICLMMQYKGRVGGFCSEEFFIDKLNKILEPYLEDIQNAQGIILQFILHNNTSICISEHIKTIDFIAEHTSSQTEILFGIRSISNIKKDTIKLNLLLFGL
jgi:cell division GTPase FtsZ